VSFEWSFFFEKLFFPNDVYLWGIFRTLSIAILAQLLGIVIGLIVDAIPVTVVKVKRLMKSI
jgi:polar amino acid transport system permease protein